MPASRMMLPQRVRSLLMRVVSASGVPPSTRAPRLPSFCAAAGVSASSFTRHVQGGHRLGRRMRRGEQAEPASISAPG